MKFIVSFFVLISCSILSYAQPFTDMGSLGLPNLAYSGLDWGDFDNDGDLDVAIMGRFTASTTSSRCYVFKNNGGTFNVFQLLGPPFLAQGDLDWGDFDNDGDLDLAITGQYGSTFQSVIYRNDGTSFVNISASLIAPRNGDIAWGDYNNDGQLDLAIIGYNSFQLYKNDNGNFIPISTPVSGNSNASNKSALDWGDYDNDGDLDLLCQTTNTKIYRNDNGIFVDINAALPNSNYGESKWADIDGDLDLDVAISGSVSGIYINNNGLFSLLNNIGNFYRGSCDFGDYDNDGDLDFFISRGNGSFLYRNDSINGFINTGIAFTGGQYSNTDWGDYDNDGDLDILISGSNGSGFFTKIYRNELNVPNQAPNAPDNLLGFISGDSISLHWNPSIDDSTQSSNLTYAIKYTFHHKNYGGWHSDTLTGYRRLANFGNVGQDTSAYFFISDAIANINKFCFDTIDFDLIWQVQAIDNGFVGSSFSAPDTISVYRILNPTLPNFSYSDSTFCFADSIILNETMSLAHYGKFENSKIKMNNVAPYIAASPRSISFWLKSDSVLSTQHIFAINSSSNGVVSYLSLANNNKLVFDDGNTVYSNTEVTDNLWHHISYTSDGALIKLYIDGNLDATFASSAVVSNNDQITIGNTSNGNSTTAFTGEIAEFSAWNIALNSQSIHELMNIAPQTNPNLICYHPFIQMCDEDSLLDFSGNDINAAIENLESINYDTIPMYNNTAYWNFNWNSSPSNISSNSNIFALQLLNNESINFNANFGLIHLIDSIHISVNPLPTPNLINDTVICSTDSIVLQSQIYESYIWNTGDTSQSIVAQSNQYYWVLVTDSNSCSGIDSTYLSYYDTYENVLGPDTTICNNENIILNPIGPFISYNWSTSEITPTIIANANANYSVTLIDTNGCQTIDSITISEIISPIVNLGMDDTICVGGQFMLSPEIIGDGPFTYFWYNGSNASLVILDTENEALGENQYFVEVTADNGCSNMDTLALTFLDCANLNDNNPISDIKVYPNPNNGLFLLTLPNDNNYLINCYAINGTLIWSKQISEQSTQIDIQNYPNGIYYLQISNEINSKTLRIIKQ